MEVLEEIFFNLNFHLIQLLPLVVKKKKKLDPPRIY